MRAVSKKTSEMLDMLYAMARENDGHVKIDNTEGVFMPVVAESHQEHHLAVAHYFEQNGDLVPDPDMEFWKSPADERWYPVSITNPPPFGYRKVLTFTENGEPDKVSPRAQGDLAVFTTQWMANIKRQQGL